MKLILQKDSIIDDTSEESSERANSGIDGVNDSNRRYSTLIDPNARSYRKNFILDKKHVSSKFIHKKMMTEMFNIKKQPVGRMSIN